MAKDEQNHSQEGQEQHLVGNGLLQVTVTTLIFRKWHVDNESPYHERMFFLDGVSLDGIGTPFYVRAWWEIPLDDLPQFEELNKVALNSILTMSSSKCTLESSEGFHFDEAQPLEGSPQVVIGMMAPVMTVVAPEVQGDSLKAELLEAKKAHIPDDEVYD